MESVVSVVGGGSFFCPYMPSVKKGLGDRKINNYCSFAGVDTTPRLRRMVVVVKAEAEGVSINPDIRKTEDKVVDSVDLTQLSKPLTAYCRCWRSGTFPLCDGSHVKHNKATGDNVGPLLLKK